MNLKILIQLLESSESDTTAEEVNESHDKIFDREHNMKQHEKSLHFLPKENLMGESKDTNSLDSDDEACISTTIRKSKPKDNLRRSLKELNSDDEACIVNELQKLVQTVVDDFQDNKSIGPILYKYCTKSYDY